ncbi:MAG: hypothetical protein Q8R98_14665, partial [Rubrivivax sp.]|nr:hypothetical protein [Rubrivivax sp.]
VESTGLWSGVSDDIIAQYGGEIGARVAVHLTDDLAIDYSAIPAFGLHPMSSYRESMLRATFGQPLEKVGNDEMVRRNNGEAGNDLVRATAGGVATGAEGDDILIGADNATLDGGPGDDIYVVSAGTQVTIAPLQGAADRLYLDDRSGIVFGASESSRLGQDLVLTYSSGLVLQTTITLAGWFEPGAQRLAEVKELHIDSDGFWTLGVASDIGPEHIGVSVRPVFSGSITSGTLSTSEDKDFFEVRIDSVANYALFSSGGTDTTGSLYDSNYSLITTDFSSGEGNNFSIVRSLVPGTYYVGVTGGSAGAYSLHVEGPGAGTTTDDHGFTAWSATNTGVGATTTGTLSTADDQDYFKFSIDSVGTYFAYTTGSTDTTASLYDSNYGVIETDFSDGEGSNFAIARVLAPGTYYIGVSGGGAGSYQLHLDGPGAGTVTDDHGFTPWAATDVSTASLTSGILDSADDVDFFKLSAASGGSYVLASTGSTDTTGTLYDANYSPITSDFSSGGGGNFSISRELTSGTYYLGVTGGGAGAYQLQVTGPTGGPGPVPWPTTSVAVGSVTVASLATSTEHDYFKLTVANSGTYVLYTTGSTATAGILYDSGYRQITSDTMSGEGSNFAITTTLVPGTYYVDVTGGLWNASGAYQLHVDGAGAGTATDDHGYTPWSATTVTVGSTTSGILSAADDQDYFKLTVANSGTYVLYSTGSTDTTGVLYDSGYRQIASDASGGEGGNFSLTRSLPPGTYYVGVTGGGAGAYQFHASGPTGGPGPVPWPTTATNVGSVAAGSLAASTEHDYFEFTVSNVATYVAYTTGSTDTTGSLYDGSYNLVASDFSSGQGSNFAVTRHLVPGTYYIDVTGPGAGS